MASIDTNPTDKILMKSSFEQMKTSKISGLVRVFESIRQSLSDVYSNKRRVFEYVVNEVKKLTQSMNQDTSENQGQPSWNLDQPLLNCLSQLRRQLALEELDFEEEEQQQQVLEQKQQKSKAEIDDDDGGDTGDIDVSMNVKNKFKVNREICKNVLYYFTQVNNSLLVQNLFGSEFDVFNDASLKDFVELEESSYVLNQRSIDKYYEQTLMQGVFPRLYGPNCCQSEVLASLGNILDKYEKKDIKNKDKKQKKEQKNEQEDDDSSDDN